MRITKSLFGFESWYIQWLRDTGCDVPEKDLNRELLFNELEQEGLLAPLDAPPLLRSLTEVFPDLHPLNFWSQLHILRKEAPYALIKVYRDSYIKVARCPLVNRNQDLDREVKRSYAERKELKRLEREKTERDVRMAKFEDFAFRHGIPAAAPKVTFQREVTADVIARELEKLERCPDWVENRDNHEYEKERCNLSRASNTILELAMCNDWDWFATFTVKKELMDRYDLPSLNRKFSLMIRDLNDKFNCEIKYLSVPETHKDGAWHLHVMLSGVPDKLLKDFHMKSKIKIKLKKYLSLGQRVAHIPLFDNSIGASTLIQIKDTDEDRIHVALYFKKYVTKEIKRLCNDKHKRLFYSSHGLKRAVKIFKGGMITDKKFDYVKVDESKISSMSDVVPSLSRDNKNRSAALMRFAGRMKAHGVKKMTAVKMEPQQFVSYKKWCSYKHRNNFKDKPAGKLGYYKFPCISAVMYECSVLKSPMELFKFCCDHWYDGSEFGERPNLTRLKEYFKEKKVLANV